MTFDREGVTIVIRNVPARSCPQCGEQYFDADTTDRLLEMTQEATRAGVSVGIQDRRPPRPIAKTPALLGAMVGVEADDGALLQLRRVGAQDTNGPQVT